MNKPPDLGALMKSLGQGAGKPAPPAQEPIKDAVEKGPKRTGTETAGAKQSVIIAELQQERDFTVRVPTELDASGGQKDAERLKILSRAPLFQQGEKRWLEKTAMKLQVPGQLAAKKLGFGPWKKKYQSKVELVEALQAYVAPVFEKLWSFQAPRFTQGKNEERFVCTFEDIPGDPVLHPHYLSDLAAYELIVNQDDLKHVCHSYVMVVAHGYLRHLVARKRAEGIDVVAQATGLLPEHLYVLECNLVQHYVPSQLTAYFEHQPMRALGREIANSFRKLAFGGQ